MPRPDKPARRPSLGVDVRSALRPAFAAATVAAAAGLGLAVLALWLADGAGGSPLDVCRSAARVWLTVQGGGLEVDGIDLGLLPLGGLLLGVAVVGRVAAAVLAEPVDEPAAFVASTAGAYGVLAAVAAAVASTGDAEISTVRAAFVCFVVGGLGAALGQVARQGVPEAWWSALPDRARAVIGGAAIAVGAVVVVAFVLVLVALVRTVERGGDLWALLDPGVGGGIVLAAVCVLLVPTVTMWVVAVLVGPGFVVGTGTSVDLTGSYLGEVPGLPLLAALPEPGAFPAWAFALRLVPVLAAIVAGWRLVRAGRVETGKDFWAGVGVAAGAGAAAGLTLVVLAVTSAGSVGPGRMSEVGPTDSAGLLVVVPVMAMGAAIGAVLAHYRGGRATHP